LIQEEHQRRGTLLSDFRWLATELSEGAPISVPSLSKTDRQRYQSLFALERSLTETTAKVEVPAFDVFLSYNSEDRARVTAIADMLRASGIRPWLDVSELRPGMSWAEGVGEALANTKSAAIFIGSTGLSPWQTEEVRSFLQKFSNSGRSVFPVLLPDTKQSGDLPTFLRRRRVIRLGPGHNTGIEELVRAITGSRAGTLRVFLAHSAADKPVVRKLYNRLRGHGIDPWLDEHRISPGEDWDFAIRRAIRETDVVAVCLSRASTTKEGFVQKEIRYALDELDSRPTGTILIVPVRLEDCDVPVRLRSWQWVDLFEEPGFDRLVSSLNAIAGSIASRSA
jgi:nucleotide-binding universal stress UspA family protein